MGALYTQKGTPDSTQSDLTNVHPYSIVNVLTALVNSPHENTQLGNAQKDFEKAMLAGAEVCKHILAKIASLAETKSNSNVRNLRDVKELFIHMSYLVTYGIGRFKTLHERCVNDVKKMGFTQESDFVMVNDRIDDSSTKADGQEDGPSDHETPDAQNEDDDDDCEIIEQPHTIIEVDSDDETPPKEAEAASEEVATAGKQAIGADVNSRVTTTSGEPEKDDSTEERSLSAEEKENAVEKVGVAAGGDASIADAEKIPKDGGATESSTSSDANDPQKETAQEEGKEPKESTEDKDQQVELIEISDKEVSELLDIHISNDEETSKQNANPPEQTAELMEVIDSDEEAARKEATQDSAVEQGSNSSESITGDKRSTEEKGDVPPEDGTEKLSENAEVENSNDKMEEDESANKAGEATVDQSAQQKDTEQAVTATEDGGQGSHNDASLLDELEHSSKGSSSEILNLMDAADDSYHSDSSDMQFTSDFTIQEVRHEEAPSKREATDASTSVEEPDGTKSPGMEVDSPTASETDEQEEAHCTKEPNVNEESEAIEVLDSSEESDSSKNTTVGEDDAPKGDDAPVPAIVEESSSAASLVQDQTEEPVVEEQIAEPQKQALADGDNEELVNNVKSPMTKLPTVDEQETEKEEDEEKERKEEEEKESGEEEKESEEEVKESEEKEKESEEKEKESEEKEKESEKEENESEEKEIESEIEVKESEDEEKKSEEEERESVEEMDKEEITDKLNSEELADKGKEVPETVSDASCEKEESLCASNEVQDGSNCASVANDTVEISSSSEDGCEQDVCMNEKDETSQKPSPNDDTDPEPMDVDSEPQHSSVDVAEKDDDTDQPMMEVTDEVSKDSPSKIEQPDSSMEKHESEEREKPSVSVEANDMPQVEILSEESSPAGNDPENCVAIGSDEVKQTISEPDSESQETKRSTEKSSQDCSDEKKKASICHTDAEATDQQGEEQLSDSMEQAEDLPASTNSPT
uniref:Uncharacterized protein n=1 Tax=Anopheles maculatus TaxID=74869 RepID=A0A182SXA1_9DIPT